MDLFRLRRYDLMVHDNTVNIMTYDPVASKDSNDSRSYDSPR